MRKGQSLVVAAVLMILIIVALGSGILVFGTETISDVVGAGEEEMDRRIDETRASLAINSVDSNGIIEVRNIGEVELPTDFRIYVDGNHYDTTHTCGNTVEPGDTCNLNLQNFNDDPCDYDITIQGPANTWDEVEAGEAC